MIMMELFRITEISDGWFTAMLCGEYELMCSDLWFEDPPLELLSALAALSESDGMRFVSFKGEPGADILKLSVIGDELEITVYSTDCPSEGMLPDSGASLQNYCTDILYSKTVSRDGFISDVIKEFDRFAHDSAAKAYVREWNRFPASELDRLKCGSNRS